MNFFKLNIFSEDHQIEIVIPETSIVSIVRYPDHTEVKCGNTTYSVKETIDEIIENAFNLDNQYIVNQAVEKYSCTWKIT